jgi:regulator of sigma E protease
LPGETITAINGASVTPEEYWKLDQAVQSAQGKPIELTVKNGATGKSEIRPVLPHFEPFFGKQPLNFAGLMPRPAILGVVSGSSALGKVLPGDVVQSIALGRDVIEAPTSDGLRDLLNQAGNAGQSVTIVVLRGGKSVTLDGLTPNLKVDPDKGRRGLGIQLMYDEMNPVVAGIVKGSPAEAAHFKNGDRITAINGHPVATWFDVRRQLLSATLAEPATIAYTNASGPQETKLTLTSEQLTQLNEMRCSTYVELRDYIYVRKADSPLQAAKWGLTETRDFILQFYLTLRRMIGGSVSPNQLMGPVGIFVGGAKFAFKGWDWLLWFLSMISANLAVVNFLPIPIVDGGLFTFLILEKIQGKPLSPKAQAIAQYVGLAFLAGVFLFVTYHDIVRFIPNPFG